MTQTCYDFMNGRPHHFPAGTYHAQVATSVGEIELELMDILYRCWLVFQHKGIDSDDLSKSDMDFIGWVAKQRIDNGTLNRVISIVWQLQAF